MSIDWTSKECTDEELPAVRVIPNRPQLFDLWSEYCRQKLRLPDGWHISSVSRADTVAPEGFAKVEGGVYGVTKTGKKSWARRDKTKDLSCFVKLEDLKSHEAYRATELGVCAGCWGEGRIQTISSIHTERERYRTCKECGGSGNPKEAPAEVAVSGMK